MIVWLASYPRSGNTFLRLVVERMTGRGSSTVYPVDGVLERLGPELVRSDETGVGVDQLRTSSEVHFVKTHRCRGCDVVDGDASVYVVRDGRDALVSFARQRSEDEPEQFRDHLRALIERHDGGTSSWGLNVLSWLPEPAGEPLVAVIRFEDLIRDPTAVVRDALDRTAPELALRPDAAMPTFAELHRHDPAFFRRGVVGTSADEMPADLEDLFWSYPDNAAAMARLGHGRRHEAT